MVTSTDKERFAVLETKLQQLADDVELLTTAVNTLTNLLERGKGVRWFLGLAATAAVTYTAALAGLKEFFK